MDLLRERTTDVVRISFNASPRLENLEPAVSRAYQRLMDDHVIQCKQNPPLGMICEPGPAGDELAQQGVAELSLIAGRWVPASVVAIRRTGRSTAVAEVRMTFQTGQLFRDFENAFEQIQSPVARTAELKEGKLVHATFQRYDDGWHVESLE